LSRHAGVSSGSAATHQHTRAHLPAAVGWVCACVCVRVCVCLCVCVCVCVWPADPAWEVGPGVTRFMQEAALPWVHEK
jgi:hypothetical protein